MLSGSDIDADVVIALSWAIKTISMTAIYVSKFKKELTDGIKILSDMGSPIKSISSSLSKMKGPKKEEVDSFIYALSELLNFASKVGIFGSSYFSYTLKMIFGGLNEVVSMTTDLLDFSRVLEIFNREMEKTNIETKKFFSSLSQFGELSEPIRDLSSAIMHLSESLRELEGTTFSSFGEKLAKVLGISYFFEGSETSPNVKTSIEQSPGGRVLSEIRDILQETKEILAETFQGGGGNAVIVQTQNTSVSNNNSSSSPIVRPMSTNDQYYTKMRFRHHI